MYDVRGFLAIALGKGAAQIRIGAKVERREALLVLDSQIGAVGCKEARYRCGRLLVGTLSPQAHQQLNNTKRNGVRAL